MKESRTGSAQAQAASAQNPAQTDERIVAREIEDEMRKSYLDYAMSVIIGRALPDMRDGLKPVHRRILFAMNELGMLSSKPFKKSARIVGEVIGKYHPHGDTAVYDTLVRMAQDFSLRYPLIDGQGNFGSIDGDNAAAMRYTEARLSKIAEEILTDLRKETVEFQPNFDGELEEPVVLPSKFPNLLVNGSSGIAVGMATNIPPHNLREIVKGLVHLIDRPDATVADIMEFVKGPDFPTGGIIIGTAGIKNAFETGRGSIKIRSHYEIEEKKNHKNIIVTEIPYQVNKAQLIEAIADLVRDKVILGIHDIRDESDRDGMRIVFELKSDANVELVTNQLFKHSQLETSFGIITLGIVGKTPKLLGLKPLMQVFIDHRKEVVRRRTVFDLTKAKEKAHILEGLIVALDHIDDVVAKIKKSKDGEAAKDMLMRDYKLSELQAKAILDMRLQRLASLEQEKIRADHKQTLELIEDLEGILASEKRINEIIKSELTDMDKRFGNDRKTRIMEITGEKQEITQEDLIEKHDVVVTMSHAGYIKRLPIETYRQQRRGGKGIVAAATKEDDVLENLFISSTHSTVLFFTNHGQVHWLKVYEIPEASRQAKGKAIVNLLALEPNEKISAFVPVTTFDDRHFVMIATRQGVVKKTPLIDYSHPRKGGIVGVKLNEGDELIEAVLTDGSASLIIATAHGMATRFSETQVRPMGRSSVGVRGITLKDGDTVIGMVIADDSKSLLTITEQGFGKRTSIAEYRIIGRGGIGVKNIVCSDRNGRAVALKAVADEDDLMFISKNGIIIRTRAGGISQIGRNTQGVCLMKLDPEDRVVAAAKVVNEDEAALQEAAQGETV
ncbi:DNA gyrase subunit A [Candidatus Woesearchaeota archaeon]|nr:DNA gyrase subunit A [Candidatus Woesearchaeota archaeon]